MIIGVISDTHGRMHDKAIRALKDSDIIIHAGDIGSSQILEELRKIAPVYAVKGNNDRDRWAWELPLTQAVEAGGRLIYVIHQLDMLDLDVRAAGIDIVIYGHSHVPGKEERNGVLYFNPGSAGPRRFSLPVCAGKIEIDDDGLKAFWIDLNSFMLRRID